MKSNNIDEVRGSGTQSSSETGEQNDGYRLSVGVSVGFHFFVACGVEPRIALGAVAPTPIRALRSETVLAGLRAGSGLEGALSQAGEVAASEARPIDDFRASADYRRHLIRVGVIRVLQATLAQASRRSDD